MNLNFINKLLPKYQLVKKIGFGGFSDIYLVKHKKNKYTLKIIYINKYKCLRIANNEVTILKYLGDKQDFLPKLHKFIFDDNIFLILYHYIDGIDLFTVVNSFNFTESKWMEIFKKICYALYYIHSHGIAHNDIKMENILLKDNSDIVVIDFGLATTFDKEVEKHFNIEYSYNYGSGTILPPEREKDSNENIDLRKSDVYNLGCLFYVCLYKQYPDLKKDVKYKNFYIDPIIRLSLNYNFNERPTLEYIIDYIKTYKS